MSNLWDATKAVLRGKFIAVNARIKKGERFQVNNTNFHIDWNKKKKLKQKQAEEKIMRIRVEINYTLEKQ